MKTSVNTTWRHRRTSSARELGGAGKLNGVAIAIMTALGAALPAGLLYCVGRATRSASLLTWGLDPELLPLGRIETIYGGLGAGLTAVLTAVATLVLLSLYLIPIYGLNRLIATKLQQRRERKGIPAKKRAASARGMPEWIERGFTRALLFAAVSSLSVMCFFALQRYAEWNGIEAAFDQREAMTTCDPQRLPFPRFKPVVIERTRGSATERYAGFSITCASTGCAVYDPVRRVAQFVPRDGLVRFDTATVDQVCRPATPNAAAKPAVPAARH
ncbi:hypothetical protein [Burkholderia multivorans]|uniref:Uncharacterized protein n=1 Tax=Burkholderia multivorans TaxID=87883 RepID=A0AB37APB8_9BURK|nr:hypothetical protein [Burkholderia multivorans]MBU9589621.1 hypothetical protein [Burkholderia multivorans]PRE39303.1 hypothetical protein C6P97_30955 [Burkholderia multivorans]PRE42277.1 hypothetical protein C6P99_24650 [Burkholderia multivorans]